jgi:uncharacterized protein
MTRCWLIPDVRVGESTVDGRGLFAWAPIAAGTVVARLDGRHVSTADLRRILEAATSYVDTITIDDDLHLVLDPGQPIHFGNHSCDPTLWHTDAFTLVARRDIAAGEEITVDYATQTTEAGFRMECRCGSERCRGVVTGDDWRDPAWQERYRDHVVPAVARAMARSGP